MTENKAWSIGRLNANKCDILLQGETISGIHATLNFLNGKFFIIDNNSLNGTVIRRDNQNMNVNEHCQIHPSDTIIFGNSEYQLDDLIEYSVNAIGTETNALIVVSGLSLGNGGGGNIGGSNIGHNPKIISEPDPIPEPSIIPEPTPNISLNDNVKKVRCYDCGTIIAATLACHKCGSDEHL